jgi:hypothetical protein
VRRVRIALAALVLSLGPPAWPDQRRSSGKPIRVGRERGAIAVGAGSVWTTSLLDDAVFRIQL